MSSDSGNSDPSKCGCDCGSALKDHLRKCAGFGQRPPLFEGFKGNPNSNCQPASSTSGRCCPPPPPKIVIFKPQVEVPPTETFECPADCCNPPKAQTCCPPPEPPCPDDSSNANEPQQCPEVLVNTDPSCGSADAGKCPAKKRGFKCQI